MDRIKFNISINASSKLVILFPGYKTFPFMFPPFMFPVTFQIRELMAVWRSPEAGLDLTLGVSNCTIFEKVHKAMLYAKYLSLGSVAFKIFQDFLIIYTSMENMSLLGRNQF